MQASCSSLVHILMQDCTLQVLALLQQNLELNGFQERGSVRRLDWRSWRAGHSGLGSLDLLLGADLLYASAHVQVRKLTAYFSRAFLCPYKYKDLSCKASAALSKTHFDDQPLWRQRALAFSEHADIMLACLCG
jgi:hypothetical protein